MYIREQNFIKEFQHKLMETRTSLEEKKIRDERGVDISHPKFPTDIEDFVMGAPVGIFRIQSIQNISIEDMTLRTP